MYLEEWSEHGSDKHTERWWRGAWLVMRDKYAIDDLVYIWLYHGDEELAVLYIPFRTGRTVHRIMIGYMCEYASDPLV
jgi:hypothetical protein